MTDPQKLRATLERFRKQCRGGAGIGFEETIAALTDMLRESEQAFDTAIDHISINPAISSHANVVRIQARLRAELQAAQKATLDTGVESDHCPHCDSQDFEMIGDPEYNDLWLCHDCKQEFGRFITKGGTQESE